MFLLDYPVFTALATAFVAALCLVPAVRRLSHVVGLIDRPDAERKLHEKPIALGGGLAVFAATLIAIFAYVGFEFGFSIQGFRDGFTSRWLVLFGASAAILVVGLIDDAWALRGRQKLLAQCLIAMVIVGSGTSLSVIGVGPLEIRLGIFALPVSVIWLLLAINALNLLDGADGMATTVGICVATSLGLVSIGNHGVTLNAIASLALAGALLGFLVFNRPPATIFLGDAGSMMIGLMIGVLSMWCSAKETTAFAAAPIAILILPLFDSSAAIIRRWMTGRSMYVTDRGHLHHRLREKFGPIGMLVVVAGACILSGGTAVLATVFEINGLTPVGAICVLACLVATRTFGHSEIRLLATRLWHLGCSFFIKPHHCDTQRHERRVQLQGEGAWTEVWNPLVEFAKIHQLSRIKIDVNMAWLHEGYHANWQAVRLPEKVFQNVIKLPLFAMRESNGEVEQVPIGRLEAIVGTSDDSFSQISEFLGYAQEVQRQVQELVARIEAEQQAISNPSKSPQGSVSRNATETELTPAPVETVEASI